MVSFILSSCHTESDQLGKDNKLANTARHIRPVNFCLVEKLKFPIIFPEDYITDLSSSDCCSQKVCTDSCQALVRHVYQKGLNTLPVTPRPSIFSQAVYIEVETLQILT